MLTNITSIINQYIESVNRTLVTNDLNGAIIFIVVVLVWYSSSIVFLLGMQMKTSKETPDESTTRSTKLFEHSFRDLTNNKEILEQLANKEKRDKLWDIYLGTSGDMHDKIIRADTARIRNIEKQLATLDESCRDDFIYFPRQNLEEWSSDTSLTRLNSRQRPRRRSSLDYQILEEWKTLSDELKTHENWPWAIRKLIIRRNLRRQQHISECGSAP
ncbi:unnamed protein product [Rotaria magnacalcarata]